MWSAWYFSRTCRASSNADKEILPSLTVSDCRKLIADGVATGGMQAKLNAACDAVLSGVGEVRIVRGSDPSIVERVFGGEQVGTGVIA